MVHLPIRLFSLISLLISCAIALAADPARAIFIGNEADAGRARMDFLAQEKTEALATFYLFDGNKVGAAGLAEGREAARRGVAVKLIIDGLTVPGWMDRYISPQQIRAATEDPEYRKSGGSFEIRIFNPVNKIPWHRILGQRTFMRAHHKLLILGGGKVLGTGDRNHQNVNFRLRRTDGQRGLSYRSMETFIAGGKAPLDARRFFLEMWDNAEWVRPIDVSKVTDAEVAFERRKFDKMASALRKIREAPSYQPRDWLAEMKPVEHVQFLSDPLDGKGKTPGMEIDLLRIIAQTKWSLVIFSPYVLLTPEFEREILNAVERKVDVKLYTADLHATDAKIAYRAFEPQAAMLMRHGVKVFLHQGPDMMHAKGLVSDGRVASVNSYNADYLSQFLNMESGVVVEDAAYAQEVLEFGTETVEPESKLFQMPKRRLGAKCFQLFIELLSKIPRLRRQI